MTLRPHAARRGGRAGARAPLAGDAGRCSSCASSTRCRRRSRAVARRARGADRVGELDGVDGRAGGGRVARLRLGEPLAGGPLRPLHAAPRRALDAPARVRSRPVAAGVADAAPGARHGGRGRRGDRGGVPRGAAHPGGLPPLRARARRAALADQPVRRRGERLARRGAAGERSRSGACAGRHEAEPLEVWLEDVLGLCRSPHVRCGEARVTVLPRPTRVDGARHLLAAGGDDEEPRTALRLPTSGSLAPARVPAGRRRAAHPLAAVADGAADRRAPARRAAPGPAGGAPRARHVPSGARPFGRRARVLRAGRPARRPGARVARHRAGARRPGRSRRGRGGRPGRRRASSGPRGRRSGAGRSRRLPPSARASAGSARSRPGSSSPTRRRSSSRTAFPSTTRRTPRAGSSSPPSSGPSRPGGARTRRSFFRTLRAPRTTVRSAAAMRAPSTSGSAPTARRSGSCARTRRCGAKGTSWRAPIATTG